MFKYLTYVFFLIPTFLFAQKAEQIISLYKKYNFSHPVEKIYVQIDKPYYAAGEFIYMRAYLTNAQLDTNTVSRIIYVEISDVEKRLVNRTLLYSDKNEFTGQIHLPDSLPSANYHLRAYTNWMRNAGEDYFSHRDIYIGNDSAKTVVSKREFDYQVSFFRKAVI